MESLCGQRGKTDNGEGREKTVAFNFYVLLMLGSTIPFTKRANWVRRGTARDVAQVSSNRRAMAPCQNKEREPWGNSAKKKENRGANRDEVKVCPGPTAVVPPVQVVHRDSRNTRRLKPGVTCEGKNVIGGEYS